jgi:L-threonylcarbamoyladenylate synthase
MFKNFYHFDLYNIEEAEEFKDLGIEEILEGKNIVCMEWGEKIGELYQMLKEKAEIVYVKIEYVGEEKREIKVNF